MYGKNWENREMGANLNIALKKNIVLFLDFFGGI